MAYFREKDIALYYETTGKGSPLIFLHGSFLDISFYKDLIEALSKKYKVYAIDLPMHGNSSVSYVDFNKMADLMHSFVLANKIKKPVFCGHSAGCAISIIYASKHSTKKLILIEPAGLKYFKHDIEFFFKVLFLLPINSILVSGIKSYILLKAGVKVFRKNFLRWHLVKVMLKELKCSLESEMMNIKCPADIIWSRNDEIIPFRYSALFMKFMKNSKLTEAKGSHNWPILDKKQVSEVFR